MRYITTNLSNESISRGKRIELLEKFSSKPTNISLREKYRIILNKSVEDKHSYIVPFWIEKIFGTFVYDPDIEKLISEYEERLLI